jgi:cytochrome b involved in lipid metabolism
MNSKIVIPIVLGLILSVGGVFFFRNKSTPSPVTSLNTPEVVGEITLMEVSSHSSQTDCWLAIEGQVYDVTSFIPSHPGGEQILLGCGKDATGMFNSRPSNGTSHSTNARTISGQYRIGTLAK